MTRLPQKVSMAVPALRRGKDAEAAAKLRELIMAAQDGLRRILICGLFIEEIAADLPHGALKRWVTHHLPDVTIRTVERWRAFAVQVRGCIGVRLDAAAALPMPLHEALAIEVEALPVEVREVRAKIDELIAGKSYRQLCFEFKQMEEDEEGELRVKIGRRKGQGGRAPQVPVPYGTLEAELKQAAIRDWVEIERGLDGYGIKWCALPDTAVQAQVDKLEGAIRARREWLRTPTHKRSVPSIEEMVRFPQFARL